MAAKEASRSTEELANHILAFMREGPVHFEEILLRFRDAPYREILQAWGRLRLDGFLGREVKTGKYLARDGADGEPRC
ncbi:MAG: hypothetical protein ACE5LU_11510 [Anaerolineae bacterium]